MKKILFALSLLISAILSAQNVHNTISDTSMTGPYPLGVNANLKTSANYFNQGSSFNNFSYAYGTSITFGLFAENYYTILQREIGNSTFANYAVSSTALRTACRAVATNQGIKITGASIGDPAFNNSRWAFNNINLDSAHLFAMIKAGSRWLAAAQFTDTLQFYRVAAGTVNPNVTTSQAAVSALALDTLKDLGSRAVFFGTNVWMKNSTTTNETYTNTNVKGKNLIIGVWADSLGGSRIQYAVDGVSIGTYDPNNRAVGTDLDAPTGFHRVGIMNDVIVINGLKDTLHTVVLTFLDGSKFSGVDFIGNMKEPFRASLAPIYVMDILHMNATGYAVTSGSAVVQDSASNSRWQDLRNTFPSYIGASAIVRVNCNISAGGHYDPSDATQINADGIHPMGPGYRNMVIDIINAINPKSIPLNYITTLPATVVPGGSNGQFQFNNSGTSFAGSSVATTDGTNVFIPDIYGTNGVSGTLTLHSTSNGTKGKIILDATRGSYYNESVGNMAIGTTVSSVFAYSAAYSDLTGGGAIFPGLLLQNTSSTSPGGGQYNIAPINLTAGNGAVTAQFAANYGSGATAPFTVQGFVFGTRSNDPVIFYQNSVQIARLDATGLNPFTTASYDFGTPSLAWRSVLTTGANSHGHVNVSGTGTYSALGTDYTIEFTGTTATLAYPTVNLVNGRQLQLINYASGSITIPSTKSGNAATITTLTTNQRAIVEYDLATTTWIIVSLN